MPAPTQKPPSRKPSTPSPLPFELRRSDIQGTGAFATRRIRKGARIIEYTGERISQAEADARYDDAAMGRHHTFLFNVDEDTVVDGAVGGNESRFINHSCDPNCQAFIEEDSIFIFALRDIEAGEELGYDYGYERSEDMGEEEEQLYVCRCGAAKCRGTILAPPPKPKARPPAKKAKGKSGDSKGKARGKTRGDGSRPPQPKKPGGSRRRTSSASLA